MAKQIKQSQVTKPVHPSAAVPTAQDVGPWYLNFRIQAVIVGLLAVVFYANTYENEIAFDDNIVIAKNEYVLEGFAGIHDLLTKDGYESYYRQFNSGNQLSGGRYRPLSLVTFAIEQQFFGPVPVEKVDSVLKTQMSQQVHDAFEQKMIREMHLRHVFNVLWYTLAVIVLLYFLRYIVFRGSPLMAFVAAALFTIHPIHTEVVANVKSRDEIMSLLFICLTFIFAFKYKERGKVWMLGAALLSYLLAFLSKEYAITLVVLLPLAFYLFSGFSIRKSLVAVIPYAVVAFLYLAMRMQIVQPAVENSSANILNNPYAFATGGQKAATELSTSLRYLKLLIFPHPLSYDYSYNQIPYKDFGSPVVWLAIVFYIGMFAGFVYSFKKRNVWCFAIAFYLAFLLLVCNILFDIGATMGERLIYHSSVGFSMAVAWLLVTGAERIKPAIGGKLALASVMLAIIVLCGFTTITRNKDWKNNLTLSQHDLKSAPNSVLINTNVAIALMNGSDREDPVTRRRDIRKAIDLFGKAASIYPGYDKAYINRGLAYFRLGVFDSVLPDLNRALALNPAHPQLPNTYFNLGVAFCKNREYDFADTCWAKAARLDPANRMAVQELNGLRNARMQAGQ